MVHRNHMPIRPLKVYCLLIVILTVLTMLYLFWKDPKDISSFEKTAYLNTYNQVDSLKKIPAYKGEKIVHLDLKGAPPKISYYTKLFPLLAKLGATGILIEYEDMFPYMDDLANISALNAYTLNDIAIINMLAKKYDLKLIPLIQTFGHIEFILKLEEYKHYREDPLYPQAICPTYNKTIALITSIVTQIMKAHPNSKIIHIGADEVFYLGTCDRCLSFMQKFNFTKQQLFIEHVKNVARIISNFQADVKILMWDDELRSFSPLEMRELNLNKNIEPVVWKYSQEVYDELGPSLWEEYAKTFPTVWAASAFKGATGSNEYVSKVSHYLQNHRGWLSIIMENKNRINFRGIIITGWQRYDHFAVLCELLPVGIPTLAMSLRLLEGYNDSPLSPPTEVAKVLHCSQPYGLVGSVFGSPKCTFPGGNILEYVLAIQLLRQEFDSILDDSRVRGWMSEYNIKYSFSSPNHVDAVTVNLKRIKDELNDINGAMTIALMEVYDNYTIVEWKETYLLPFENQVNRLFDARKKLIAKDSWPKRPLNRDEL